MVNDDGIGGAREHFLTTHWTMVVAAGEKTSARSLAALETLCQAYWYPLYAHVRRQGFDVHESQDLTQEFFHRLLSKNQLRMVDREKGRFRSFLLASLKHFLCNEWDRRKALKRGGGKAPISLDDEVAEARFQQECSNDLPPDEQFEKAWALALLERAMNRLRAEQGAAGKEAVFDVLKQFLSAKPAHGEYEDLSGELGMTANAIGVTVKRLRLRYRALIEMEVADTVADPGNVAEEMNHVLMALAR